MGRRISGRSSSAGDGTCRHPRYSLPSGLFCGHSCWRLISRGISLAVRSIIALLFLATPLAAQVVGTWKLASQPDLPALIEQVTATMKPVARTHARDQLRQNNPVCGQITIAHEAGQITIRYDHHQPQRMPDNARAVPWIREDGQTFLISAHIEGANLIHTLMGEDGMRKSVFQVDHGVMTLSVTVKAMVLPKPFTYTLVYHS